MQISDISNFYPILQTYNNIDKEKALENSVSWKRLANVNRV